MQEDNSKLSKYKKSVFNDVINISSLTALLAKHEIKADLKNGDKDNDIDGYLIITEGEHQKAKFEVQVKPAQQRKNGNWAFGFKDTKFFEYCKSGVTKLPILLIGVCDANSAYWEYLSEDFLNKQTNKTITFQSNKIISEEDTKFKNEWLEIFLKHKSKVVDESEYINKTPSISSVKEIISPIPPSEKINKVIEKLSKYRSSFVSYYNGALRVIRDKKNPDRIAQAAHSIREIFTKFSEEERKNLTLEEKNAIFQEKNMEIGHAYCLNKMFKRKGDKRKFTDPDYLKWTQNYHEFFVKASKHSRKKCMKKIGREGEINEKVFIEVLEEYFIFLYDKFIKYM